MDPTARTDAPAVPPVCAVAETHPLLRSLGARNPRSARRWAAVALLATIATSLVCGAATTGGVHAAELGTAFALTVIAVLLLCLRVERAAPLVVLAPLSGVGAVVWLDLVSRDAGVTGQVFFIVPAIWAAAQLRPAGAALVTAATIAGEGVVVFTLLPTTRALTEFAYVTVLLLLITGALTRAGATQERLVEQLRVQAGIDPVTGLVTRRVLDSATEQVVRAAAEGALDTVATGAENATGAAPTDAGVCGDAAAEAAFVVIDLDRFKLINDTHGHLGGDAALAHVAALLTAQCREDDVVARMGGDELAVLMMRCPADIAVRRAQSFVDAVRQTPLRLSSGVQVPLSISAGLTSMSPQMTCAQDLYARADLALYEAKRAGRDRLAHTA